MSDWRKPGATVAPGLWAIGGVGAILIALWLSITHWTDLKTYYALYRAEAAIRSSQSKFRPVLGRLTAAPYAPFEPDKPTPDELGRAQIILLNIPSSSRTKHLQALIDIGLKKWQSAAQNFSKLKHDGNGASFANSLGVVFLQLADHDATYLFRALDQFEEAEKINPEAPEPHFNRLFVLRQLHLTHQEQAEQSQYTKIENTGRWHDELLRARAVPEEQIAGQLQSAIDNHDGDRIVRIFLDSPELCRDIAMRYGMNPLGGTENETVAASVGALISKYYGDETVSSMLVALKGPDRAALINARKFVAEGADNYLKDDLKSSLAAYDNAAQALQDVDSRFDHLWLDVNRAITEIRFSDVDAAKTALDNVVREARASKFKWIFASALSTYGSLRPLNSSFTEMMGRLEEAVRICDEIAAPRASTRARFYMMGQTYFGGDLDGTLQLSLDCLKLLNPTERLRLGSVLAVLDVVLYKKGFLRQAVTVGEEAVSQATESHNPLVIGAATTSLAMVSELSDQRQTADAALARAELEVAAQGIEGAEQVRLRVAVDNTRARILLHRRQIAEATTSLERSRNALDQNNLIPVATYTAETLTLLGQAYALTNRFEEAQATFQQAVDAAENDSDFVKNERAQLAFDDARREMYESAIGFEYEHGSKDAAWTYLQQYRAKTFIEVLARFNPAIEKIHSIALDRQQVQKAIPRDMQTLEYALLPDRVLIWVVTNDKFETRSVPIPRDEVEQKIQNFLADIRAGKPFIRGNAELYDILIGPVVDLLQNGSPVAIIPDRALHGLPFGAIRCPENRYLIEYYPIIESPTLTHLLAADSSPVRRDKIVTFGSRSDDVAENREISSIKAIYRTVSPFTGADVTKARFLEEMERAPIFHYAGHSAHDAADPLRSAILLDGDKGGPNSVTAVDIVGRQLRPNALVILSSCDSSVGNSKDGVGIRGLTSAFLVSGASAVVGSLWPVESTSTSELMIGFHKAFAAEHLPIAQALRKAQLAFIEANPKRSHPYYWSRFVVTSNFSALR